MLIYSMSVSVDGFIADREGAFRGRPLQEEFRRAPDYVDAGRYARADASVSRSSEAGLRALS
jgi:hypothetical protein